ncbi:hypothetical protein [Vibrio phage vB_VibM_83AMN]|nr:hypothetical protein [Vibrio phage vB_VibM_83AMN]
MSEAEAMGAYEAVYDEYEEGLVDGLWAERNGNKTSISKMSDTHIKNCIRLCKRNAYNATFTNESDKWNEWVDLFEDELYSRSSNRITSNKVQSTKQKRKGKAGKKVPTIIKSGLAKLNASSVIMICACGQEYEARVADLKRGWALSCSKRCASIRREFGRPCATFKKIAEV